MVSTIASAPARSAARVTSHPLQGKKRMSNLPTYEVLAQAFASEGVDTLFNLMGDGNMHWATAMSKIDGMRVFHARHEAPKGMA